MTLTSVFKKMILMKLISIISSLLFIEKNKNTYYLIYYLYINLISKYVN